MNLDGQLGSSASQEAIQDIATVANTILSNLEICMYDSAIVVIRNLADHRLSKRRIKLLVAQATVTAEASSRTMIREYVGSNWVEPRQPEPLNLAEDQYPIYIALLDYITVLIGHFLTTSVSGDAWTHRCLGVLVRMTTKLKLVGRDPVGYARESIENGQTFVSGLKYEAQTPGKKETSKLEALSVDKWYNDLSDPVESFVDIVDETVPTEIYYMEQFRMRLGLGRILKMLLRAITRVKEASDESPFSFEMNTIVCARADDSPLLLISSDRHRYISVSSEQTQIRICYAGCQLLLWNLESLASTPSRLRSSTETTASGVIGGTIDWIWSEVDTENGSSDNSQPEDHRNPAHVDITTPEAYVSVLLSLVMSSSAIATHTARMISLIQVCLGTEKGIKVYIPPRFDALFTFKTSSHEENARPDIVALSCFRDIRSQSSASESTAVDGSSEKQSLLKRASNALTLSQSRPLSKRSNDLETGPDVVLDQLPTLGVQKSEEIYRYHQSTMETWNMSQKAVTVPCKRFVISTVSCFGAIIALGITLIFTCSSETKNKGIDISNILFFLWTVALFGVGLSKSWYIKDWSWHDFMRGQMVCQSVEQLHRVTKVDSQAILMYLLRHDNRRFYTTGPYNSLFINSMQKVNALKDALESVNGFDIDQPLRLSTLLACGFLVFKVAKPEGSYLVCVGGRKKTESVDWGISSKRLVCKAPNPNSTSKEKGELYFKEQSFVWGKAFGLYADQNTWFG